MQIGFDPKRVNQSWRSCPSQTTLPCQWESWPSGQPHPRPNPEFRVQYLLHKHSAFVFLYCGILYSVGGVKATKFALPNLGQTLQKENNIYFKITLTYMMSSIKIPHCLQLTFEIPWDGLRKDFPNESFFLFPKNIVIGQGWHMASQYFHKPYQNKTIKQAPLMQ